MSATLMDPVELLAGALELGAAAELLELAGALELAAGAELELELLLELQAASSSAALTPATVRPVLLIREDTN
jgi:hypothetical protein